MTAMEDSGVINAIQRLEQVGRADTHRILVLRTGSDYSMQYPGEDAVTSLVSADPAGLQAALDAAHIVGSRVVNEITGHWDLYRNAIPGGARCRLFLCQHEVFRCGYRCGVRRFAW